MTDSAVFITTIQLEQSCIALRVSLNDNGRLDQGSFTIFRSRRWSVPSRSRDAGGKNYGSGTA